MGDGNAARISVSEMKSYYIYSEWCSWLLSVAEGESLGLVTHGPFGVTHSQSSRLRWLLFQCSSYLGHAMWRFLVLVREDVLVNDVYSLSPWSLE